MASVRRPWVAVAAAASCGLAAAAYGVSAGRSLREIRALALVTPLYAVGHGLGMWRGLGELVRSRARTMILVVFGTTGELIKLAPVLLRLERRNIPYVLGRRASRSSRFPRSSPSSASDSPTSGSRAVRAGRDLRVTADVPGWLATVGRSFAARRSWLRNSLSVGPGRPLVLVHGDTMTTVLGAAMGRALRVAVAHIEGGLRSYTCATRFLRS